MRWVWGLCVLVFILLAGGEPVQAKKTGLEVLSVVPEGPVTRLTQITVRFSEPMRPLGQSSQDSAGSTLELKAQGVLPDGAFRWIDPTTLAYIFAQPVNEPVQITAHIPAGTKALSGNVLSAGITWKISTPELAFIPHSEQLPPTGACLRFTSNYALDLPTLQKHTQVFLGSDKGRRTPLSVQIEEVEAGLDGEGWIYQVALPDGLPFGETVTLRINKGIKLRQGSTSFQGWEDVWQTVSPLQVALGLRPSKTDSYFFDSESRFRPEAPLSFDFSNPVSRDSLLKHLEIRPEASLLPTGMEDDAVDRAGSSDFDSQQSFFYTFSPRTKYTVTVKAGLADQYGSTLQKDVVLIYPVGDYRPESFGYNGLSVMERKVGVDQVFMGGCNIRSVNATAYYVPFLQNGVLEPAVGSKEFFAWNSEQTGLRTATVSKDYSKIPNTLVGDPIDLESFLGLHPGGLQGVVFFDAAIDLQNKRHDGQAEQTLYQGQFIATDLAVTSRIGSEGGLAWVTSIASGKPVPDATVSLYGISGKRLWSGKSDSEGLAQLPGKDSFLEKSVYILAAAGKDISVSRLQEFFGNAQYQPQKANRLAAHTVTQLPLYQPGEEVQFTVFLKTLSTRQDASGSAYPFWEPLQEGVPVKVEIYDSRSSLVLSKKSVSNAYGSITDSLQLASTAALGRYRVAVTNERTGMVADTWPFTVASVRPPDFLVDVHVAGQQVAHSAQEAPLSLEVEGKYFAGGALKGSQVGLEVETRETTPDITLLSGYHVGAEPVFPWFRQYHHDYTWPYVERFERAAYLEGLLGQEGKAIFQLGMLRPLPGSPLEVRLVATATDVSGLTSQGSAGFMLHSSSYYVGLKAPFSVPVGAPTPIHLKGATYDNRPLPQASAMLTVEYGGARHAWPDDKVPHKSKQVATQTVTLDASGEAKTNVEFANPGIYRLTVSVSDSEGRENITRWVLFAQGDDTNRFFFGEFSNGQLQLELDKAEYTDGATAHISFENPLGQATALVTLEREGIYTTRIEQVSAANSVVSLPISDQNAPFAFASVVLIKGRTAPPPVFAAGGQDVGAPQVLAGSALVNIKGKSTGLSLSLKADSQTYRPGGVVTVSLGAHDTSGQPAKAQVTLLAVDSRRLRAAGDTSVYTPQSSFSPVQATGIWSADTRTRLFAYDLAWRSGIGRFVRAASPSPLMARSSDFLDLATAGGGGQQPGSIREQFGPNAYWLGVAETDEAGMLTRTFTLPDSLTEYRIVAVAVDKGGVFATAEESITATKPLQLFSALPRFVVSGDTFEAVFIVRNESGIVGSVSLEAEADGVLALQEKATLHLPLAVGERKQVLFQTTAAQAGNGSIRLRGRLGQEVDEILVHLPVLEKQRLITVATAGMLSPSETFSLPVALPTQLDSRSNFALSLGASPAAGVKLSLDGLISYPWHCLEQSLSRSWARALRLSHGELLGLQPESEDREKIAEVFQRVPEFQAANGGFSLWPKMHDPDLFLTAYVLLVSKELEALQVGLHPEIVDKALNYLSTSLTQAYEAKEQRGSQSNDALAVAYWVLCRYDQHAGSNLYTKALRHIQSSKQSVNPVGYAAFMLATYELPHAAGQKKNLADLRKRLEKSIVVTATQTYFRLEDRNSSWRSMGSLLRDNGLVLWALCKVVPDYPRLEALAFWVSQGLGEKENISTQEAMFGVLGLTEYLHHLRSKQPVRIRADWKGQEQVTALFTTLTDPPKMWNLSAADLQQGQGEPTLHLTAEEGRAYWTGRLHFIKAGQQDAEAMNAGFVLQRSWKQQPWVVGDQVGIIVTLVVPETRRHVLLYDPFPAGLEPLFVSRADLAESGQANQLGAPWAWQELREDGLLLYAKELLPGTYTYEYTLRAATPGTFMQRPSYVEEMYTPEVYGTTANDKVTISP